METIYFAGGCLWGVQAFMKTLPGVVATEAGRINGTSKVLDGKYDGYAECVKTEFDSGLVTVDQLMNYFFEIIDPFSLNQQGEDIGEKYRTGVYSDNPQHLKIANDYLQKQTDFAKIMVEILPVSNYVASADEHQDRLDYYPEDHRLCHIPLVLLNKYK